MVDSIKKPENTNAVIAIATVVIAVATVFTYLEVHSGSTQTNRIITADERMAAAMETSNAQTARQVEISERAWVTPSVNPSGPLHEGNTFDIRTNREEYWQDASVQR